jgi:hypothetical protein
VIAAANTFTGRLEAFGGGGSVQAVRGPAGTVFTEIGGQRLLTVDNGPIGLTNAEAETVVFCDAQCILMNLEVASESTLGVLTFAVWCSRPISRLLISSLL